MPNQNPDDQQEYGHASNQTPNILTQKHIRSDFAIIRVGLSTDRPTTGNSQLIFWFSSNTNVLSYWNTTSETWVSTTLS